MTTQPIPVVYTDYLGTTHTETYTTTSAAVCREEELERAGYIIVHG